MSADRTPVMQPRCVHCGREQYMPAVWGVSHGELGCAWCGRIAPVLYDQAQYAALVRAALS